MSKQFDKMVVVLKELFQLDQPDLDFGIYRIMHAKAEEITRFLEKDLLPQVKEAFSQYTTADKSELEKELKKAIEQANNLGVDPETTTKVKDLRRRIADESVDVDALENEVYDHLYSFFRRYYHEGDYLSKRVYKPGVYAIPYEGEEVKLHWANRDQYYIKTSEYLRDYAFTLRPGDAKDPVRVHFRLTDVAEGEHGNIKAANGKERVFILAAEDFIAEEDGELVLRFHYRPATVDDWPQEALKEATAAAAKKPPVQKELLADAVNRVLAINNPALTRWIAELSKAHIKANGETADYSRLQGHLNRYTARFTFDYFIHKDLGSFLRRELDFFIKNEVMHLDDVENESAARVEQYLSKIKVIRKIAHKLIDFLAQLEDFQKKLWLKRKFIVETNYCITLDRIPEEFYPEIAANEAQRQEWVQLFSIDEISGAAAEPAAYSIPLSIDFLRQNRHLPVDTRFFDDGFRSRLIGSFSSLDEITDDLLVHSDNFQALQLLHPRYGEQVKCIYIDPPYNTASSSIPYKNNYKHSSFASLMHGRIEALHSFLRRDGAIFVSIDKTERTVLQHVLDDIFGDDNRVEELIWSMNTNNSQAPNYSTNHEYVLVYAKDRPVAEQDKNMFREPKPGYEEVMELVGRLNPSYPPVTEIEAAIRDLYEKHKVEYRDQVEAAGFEWEDEKGNDPWKGLFNYNRAEYRDADGNLLDEADAKTKGAKIWVWQEGDASMPATKQAASTQDPNHPNWRFYKPNHPVTGKPSPHPKSGWKFAYESGEDSPDRRSFVSLDRDGRIAWGEDENKVPRLKRMLHEVETNVGKSVFSDYSDGEKQTSAMFGRSGVFLAPKHADFVSRFIVHAGNHESIVLDCFGGSGSTAHAVIKLDREDRGKRKSVTVEVGEYFDTVLKPRVLKAIYSRDWRAGKPLLRDGISRCVKILRLESYEDALNNLDTRRTGIQQNLLDAPGVQSSDGLREQYLLRYMLDVETRGSQSLKLGPVPTLRKPDPSAEPATRYLQQNQVVLNWYPKIQALKSTGAAGGDQDTVPEHGYLSAQHIAFLDLDALFFELQRFKAERSWHNLNLPRDAIPELLHDQSWYRLLIPEEELAFDSFEKVQLWQEIATALLKKYCERYYSFRKKEWELPHLEYRDLDGSDPNFPNGNEEFPDGYYRILVEESQTEIVQKLKELKALIMAGNLRPWQFGGLRAIWFGQHLYEPLLHLAGSLVEISPTPLNAGERRFVEDLKIYYDKGPALLKDTELYLLRNMSKGRGVGFFEAGNFHPDFIIWLLVKGKQYISFVDPKGIRNMGLTDPKIQFFQTIKEIETRLSDPSVTLNSFIISNTPSHVMKLLWAIDKNDMKGRHILFQDEDKDTYIEELLSKSLTVV